MSCLLGCGVAITISLAVPVSVDICSILSATLLPMLIKVSKETIIMIGAPIVAAVSAILMIFLSVQAILQCGKGNRKIHTVGTYRKIHTSLGTLCIIFFTLHPCIGVCGWTNWIPGIHISPLSCRIVYFSGLTFYTLGKIFMYLVFAFRVINILSIYPDLQIKKIVGAYIFISIMVPAGLWGFWMYDVRKDVKPHGTPHKFRHCYPMSSVTSSANTVSVIVALVDFVLSFGALIVYFWKYHQTEKVKKDPTYTSDRNPSNIHYSEYSSTMKQDMRYTKAVEDTLKQDRYSCLLILSSLATVSTSIFTVGILFQREIGFFLSADSLINAWCVFALIFKFKWPWSWRKNEKKRNNHVDTGSGSSYNAENSITITGQLQNSLTEASVNATNATSLLDQIS